MKKKWGRLTALLLCAVMAVSLFAACGKKDDKKSVEGTTTTDSGKKEEGGKTGEDTAGGGTAGDGESTSDVLTELPLPLTEEKQTISVWTNWSNTYVDDPNTLDSVKKMEELTNVHINWVTVGIQEAVEKFGLMLASGDIPDIVYTFGFCNYPGGNDKAVEDGVFRDSTELVKKYMPNYRELRMQSPDLEKDTVTDSGRMVAITGMNSSDTKIQREKEWSGLAVRQDLLDQWGLSAPVTIEDWHTVLTTAKQNGMTEPLLTGGNGYNALGSFMTAYGVLPEFYQEDGVVKYGPAEPGYKEWVQLFRDWYSEGLLDPNFTTTNTTLSGDVIYTTTGRSLGFPVLYGFIGNGYYVSGNTDHADINVVAVPSPVLNAGDTPKTIQITSPTCGNETFISANCKNPELAAMWLDYQFSMEGMMFNYYGIEGETYHMVDGEPQYTEIITKNPDGYTATDAKSLYIRGNGCGRYDWQSVERTTANIDVCRVAQDLWTAQDMSLNLPKKMSMTEEEGTAYNSTYTAIQTLVNEMTVKFIMGNEPMEKYDDFVQQLHTYGLEECIGYQQAALDRYNQRGQ